MTSPRLGVVFRPQLPPEQLRPFVTSAQAAGLDDVWLWEDCFLEGGLTASVAALAWTDSVRVGLGLMPVPFRNPAIAAMELATVARLFPGRFVPAAGHGVLDWMAQVGARAESPMTLLREWVSAVRALLHGDTVTTSGTYVNLSEVALDWPPSSVPPLLVGARKPRTIALAGELADGVVLDNGVTPDDVRAAIAQAAAWRPLEVVVYLGVAGSAEDLAEVVRGYGTAGATTVVLQPADTALDIDPLISLAAETRAKLG
jgi:alkanesulfonate monooxygenase SsuD/methylene tetrahydromethanopterin reductase-like flavin-dependent oxidoreductase (luciferase family)